MTEAQKKEIQLLLKDYIAEFKSQKQAVNALKGTSEATVIHIRNGEWDGISDDMWRNIGKQVGWSGKGRWQFVETRASKILIDVYDDAREHSNVYAIAAQSGIGKSFVSEWFESKRENAYVVSCDEYINKKVFLQRILNAIGKSHAGYTVPEMMDLIIETARKKECPVFVLDEFDKVNDSILYFSITFYNRLEGYAGIIMQATEFLKKRILRGKRMNKKGYEEIYSRIGRRFIDLPAPNEKEVFDICKANGVNNPQDLHYIYNECEGDLRRVKKLVHKVKLIKSKKTA